MEIALISKQHDTTHLASDIVFDKYTKLYHALTSWQFFRSDRFLVAEINLV